MDTRAGRLPRDQHARGRGRDDDRARLVRQRRLERRIPANPAKPDAPGQIFRFAQDQALALGRAETSANQRFTF